MNSKDKRCWQPSSYSDSSISKAFGSFLSIFMTAAAATSNPIAANDQAVEIALSHVFCAAMHWLVAMLEYEQKSRVSFACIACEFVVTEYADEMSINNTKPTIK